MDNVQFTGSFDDVPRRRDVRLIGVRSDDHRELGRVRTRASRWGERHRCLVSLRRDPDSIWMICHITINHDRPARRSGLHKHSRISSHYWELAHMYPGDSIEVRKTRWITYKAVHRAVKWYMEGLVYTAEYNHIGATVHRASIDDAITAVANGTSPPGCTMTTIRRVGPE